MSTLYELTGSLLALYEMASDPELDEEALADTIEGVEGEIEMKADGYAKVMRSIDGDIAAVKAEMDRLALRKKHMENSKDRIKKALEEAMKATGKVKFKTDLFSFGIQKNPPSLQIPDDLDIDLVPSEYLIFAAPTVDKKKVKKAIDEGKEFSWAEVVQTEGLRIR